MRWRVLDGVVDDPRAGQRDRPAHQEPPAQHRTAMRRRFLVLLAIIVAAVVATGAWLNAQGRGAIPKYQFARVEKGSLAATVSATGTLNPVITVQVGSQVSGQIKHLFADVNSQIRKDQRIARIDPDISAAKVERAPSDAPAVDGARCNPQA